MQIITCSYHLNKLSASSWSSLINNNLCRKNCLMTSLLMWCSSNLQGNHFSIIHNNLFPHAHFHFRICHPIMLWSINLLIHALGRNTVKTYNSWLLSHITITSCESLKNMEHITLDCIKKTSQITLNIGTGLALQLCP